MRDKLTRTEKARKGKAASPWRRGAHCSTKAARASFARYVKKGRAR